MPHQNQPLVYFFGKSNFGDNQADFIKIGHTGNNLSIRQAAIQTGNEAPIWEMGIIPFDTVADAVREEQRTRKIFGAFRAQGEWFYATPRIIQYIKDYAMQHTALLTDDPPPPPPEDSSKPSFGAQLRAYRECKKMTQADVATKVDCSSGYISFIENDRGMPGRTILEALVALFGEFDIPVPEVETTDTEETDG